MPLLPLIWMLSTGCDAPPDCAAMDAGEARDWCHVEQAAALAEDDRIDDALASLERVGEPRIRAAGLYRVLPLARHLPTERVEALCTALGEPEAASCKRSWARAHLWTDKPAPGGP